MTEPDVALKERGKWAVDYVGREVIVWVWIVSFGLLIFAVTLSIPLLAFLSCGGLFVVLMLRRVFKLGRPIDDPARIAATRPQIMQDAEQETSWYERAVDALVCVFGCVCGDVIGWAIAGVLWCLFLLARSYSFYVGVAAISCGVLILALVAWQALKAHQSLR